jgi:hypothetical protein
VTAEVNLFILLGYIRGVVARCMAVGVVLTAGIVSAKSPPPAGVFFCAPGQPNFLLPLFVHACTLWLEIFLVNFELTLNLINCNQTK